MSDPDDLGPGRPQRQTPLPPPVISITVHGGSRVRVDAAITSADPGGGATAPPSGGGPPAHPPWWHRTAVLWSAMGALASVAAVALGWAASR
ncbi:hypothetical protein AB0M57_32865 [Streptomyces sp. NPDC051597]|uniref:hypothetical protein n=1 Tax=Streptomyces sp. NPDC051597 TaxID=3155049 RepID=UPI003441CE8E